MARGMSLDEFKEALSSEARDENEKLKKELEELKAESSKKIAELEEEILDLKKQCNSLGNRCFVTTKGLICMNCNVTQCKYAFTGEDYSAAAEYMTKHRMHRNAETAEQMYEFMRKRRDERVEKEVNKNG